jgi:hypothetical protein
MRHYDEADLIEMERKAIELTIDSDRTLCRYPVEGLCERIEALAEQHQQLIEYVRRMPWKENGR